VLNNKETKVEKKHGFEKVTNEKIVVESTNPKINFEAKEYYDTVHELSQSSPMFKNETENPIYKYVSSGGLKHSQSAQVTIKNPKLAPLVSSALSPTRIFQTTFKKEDCFGTKARLAKDDPIEDAFTSVHNHAFRDLYAPLDKQDFKVFFTIL